MRGRDPARHRRQVVATSAGWESCRERTPSAPRPCPAEPPSEVALRVKALESLLVEKGLVDPAALDELIETYEHKVGPHHGARVVARAWIDPAFKERLLRDGTAAIARWATRAARASTCVVVENTAKVHNLVVCTLCSCYPWPVLGLPPVWYKSAPYRSRAVIDPRGVLANSAPSSARRRRDPGVGFDLGGPLSGPARAPAGHRGLERGRAREAGDPRRDDRRRAGEGAGRRGRAR